MPLFMFSCRLCLVPEKYREKEKNAKENNFLLFGLTIQNAKENQI